MRETWSTSSALTAPISCGARANASRNTRCTRTISLVSGRVRAVADIETPRAGFRRQLHIYRPRNVLAAERRFAREGPARGRNVYKYVEMRRDRTREAPDATDAVPAAGCGRHGFTGRCRDV